MKVISNLTHLNLEVEVQSTTETNLQSNYITSEVNSTSDSDQEMSMQQLLSCVNTQLEMLYRSQHTRKYLIKEVSSLIDR